MGSLPNLCILHWQMGSLPLQHLGSPWVATLTQNNSQSHVFMGNTELLNFRDLCFIQQTQFSIKIETHLSFLKDMTDSLVYVNMD